MKLVTIHDLHELAEVPEHAESARHFDAMNVLFRQVGSQCVGSEDTQRSAQFVKKSRIIWNCVESNPCCGL